MQVAMGMLQVNEEDMQFARQIGVTHLVTRPAYTPSDSFYGYEELIQLRTRVEAAGLRVAAIHDVPAEWNVAIRQGLPDRERQLDHYCRTLENMGRAGIPILGYSFHAIKVWRTTRHARGRGGALYTGYDHALMARAPLLAPRPISAEEHWQHYAYFLQRVVPVAEAAGVKMALHPDDPPISPIGGAACIFSTMEAFERALELVPSPSNGLLFCQGCFTEMLGQGVFEAIRRLGSTGKVFYVHFRNVVGFGQIGQDARDNGVLGEKRLAFREAAIDAGDIDMVEAMRTWKEVGFDGPMMPDHYGQFVGDTSYGHRARAHAVGYMKALMQAVGGL
ncbi:MAG: mannonate dehydratase [Chloroflexi bacterium]|nr:mannonate dehydratase [Chloroflexota bacterium]